MTTQPEVLRLADALRDMSSQFDTPSHDRGIVNGAIQELRRLHAENERMRDAMESIASEAETEAAGSPWRAGVGFSNIASAIRKLLQD